MRPPLDRIPPEIACLSDYEALARHHLDESSWAYLHGGAADEITLRANVSAFEALRLNPRILNDMRGGDTAVELFGDLLDYPVLLAPVAYHRLFHSQGEMATVLGASALRAGMVVSTLSSVPLETIARQAATPLWFQLYLQPQRDSTLTLVRRAEAAGYRALVLTVDAPINGLRNREQRAGFLLPKGIEAVNLRELPAPASDAAGQAGTRLFDSPLVRDAARWDDVSWLAANTRLPVVLKGVLHPDDARLAIEHGARGLIVSNHGGRTLDTLPSTIEALPGVVEAAGGIPVLLDGGIRRGTDILKALALGARAVLVGRPYASALAAAGAVGVAHVLHLLRSELEAAMVLTGRPTLASIDRSVIWD